VQVGENHGRDEIVFVAVVWLALVQGARGVFSPALGLLTDNAQDRGDLMNAFLAAALGQAGLKCSCPGPILSFHVFTSLIN